MLNSDIKEVKLKSPARCTDPSENDDRVQSRFWIFDYPIVCYLRHDEDGHENELVMNHLADKDFKEKVFPIGAGRKFISFVH